MRHLAEQLLESVTTEATACTPEMSRRAHRADPLPRRLAFTAFVGLARSSSKPWGEMYDRLMLQPGYSRIGGGNDQIVVSDGKDVIKIDRASRAMTKQERANRVVERQRLFNTAMVYLGPFLLPQEVTVEPAPLQTKEVAVLTKQPFARIVVPDVVEQNASLTYRQLTDHGIPPSQLAGQVEQFCVHSQNVWDTEELAPDIGGRGNIVVTDEGQLVLIDSYLTDATHRNRPSIRPGFATIEQEHRVALERLERLGSCLEDLPPTLQLA